MPVEVRTLSYRRRQHGILCLGYMTSASVCRGWGAGQGGGNPSLVGKSESCARLQAPGRKQTSRASVTPSEVCAPPFLEEVGRGGRPRGSRCGRSLRTGRYLRLRSSLPLAPGRDHCCLHSPSRRRLGLVGPACQALHGTSLLERVLDIPSAPAQHFNLLGSTLRSWVRLPTHWKGEKSAPSM